MQSGATLGRFTFEDLKRRGHEPYVSTREEFSSLAGTVAFVEASIELTDQLHALGIQADHVFGVHGSSVAGLALGGKLLGAFAYDEILKGI